jgi:hypothetical protein
MRKVLTVVAVSLSSACASTPVAPVGGVRPTVEADMRSDFNLGPGQAATVEGTDIAVLFRAVTQDSRCAVDVQCVWAGDAAVALTLASGTPREERDVTLHTTLDPKAVTVGPNQLTLVSVTPQPRSSFRIPAQSYRVTLRVAPTP